TRGLVRRNCLCAICRPAQAFLAGPAPIAALEAAGTVKAACTPGCPTCRSSAPSRSGSLGMCRNIDLRPRGSGRSDFPTCPSTAALIVQAAFDSGSRAVAEALANVIAPGVCPGEGTDRATCRGDTREKREQCCCK